VGRGRDFDAVGMERLGFVDFERSLGKKARAGESAGAGVGARDD
jgi:hypothetical protein